MPCENDSVATEPCAERFRPQETLDNRVSKTDELSSYLPESCSTLTLYPARKWASFCATSMGSPVRF